MVCVSLARWEYDSFNKPVQRVHYTMIMLFYYIINVSFIKSACDNVVVYLANSYVIKKINIQPDILSYIFLDSSSLLSVLVPDMCEIKNQFMESYAYLFVCINRMTLYCKRHGHVTMQCAFVAYSVSCP